VGIVGYTNAGKSTLMNALTDAGVVVEDALFATLDTRTRRWELNGRGEALLSDTVGFIRKLPHHLVESFKATLEEAYHADLLLHVVDVSRHDAIEQAEAVTEVLGEIGCGDKRVLHVLNKTDAVDDGTALHILSERHPDAVAVSALRHEGLDALTEAVLRELQRDHVELEVTFPSSDGKLAAFLFQHADVLSRHDEDFTARMHVRLSRRHLRMISRHGDVKVRTIDGKDAMHET
ncbi:MAG TPA: GTPase, partial [Planctomycetota bacterium]|nr:GTPase [Planctomycetota bacterium]